MSVGLVLQLDLELKLAKVKLRSLPDRSNSRQLLANLKNRLKVMQVAVRKSAMSEEQSAQLQILSCNYTMRFIGHDSIQTR